MRGIMKKEHKKKEKNNDVLFKKMDRGVTIHGHQGAGKSKSFFKNLLDGKNEQNDILFKNAGRGLFIGTPGAGKDFTGNYLLTELYKKTSKKQSKGR